MVFALTWWIAQAAIGLDRGSALTLAGVPSGIVVVATTWWAGREQSSASTIQVGDVIDGSAVIGNATVVHIHPTPIPRQTSPRFHVGAVPGRAMTLQPRPAALKRLTALALKNRTAIVCAVTGTRGVGKTQLAAEYSRLRISQNW
ncbi:MAG TPA: hypothetical protein VGJ28_01450, partial [Micromonosporaceae bacterium]